MKVAPVATAVLIIAIVGTIAAPGLAHKGVTSKFTYNADVHPIFVNRCSGCHIEGGVAPMSLVKYEDAFPWAESLRAELLAAYAESSDDEPAVDATADTFVKAAHRQITARELDVVLDWATGGTPEGDATATLAPTTLRNTWAAGEPHAVATLDAPYQLPADEWESTQEFLIPLQIASPRTASRLDVVPGNPAIVRTVALSLRTPDGNTRTLGTWFPRQVPQTIAVRPPIRVEPGSQIVARIHYKKTWQFEGKAMTDRSSIGLYFTD